MRRRLLSPLKFGARISRLLSFHALARTQVRYGGTGSASSYKEKKGIVMGRVVLAGIMVALCASFAVPAFAQTNEACVLRCLDHGNLDQTCQARCTKGVPPAEAPAPSRTAAPANVAPTEATSPPPAAAASPPSGTAPSAPQPAAIQSLPQPAASQVAPQPAAVQSAPQQPAAQTAPQPAANQAPQQPTAQATPQQSVKPPSPPARPVNERCVLMCLEHGHLNQYCERVCAR